MTTLGDTITCNSFMNVPVTSTTFLTAALHHPIIGQRRKSSNIQTCQRFNPLRTTNNSLVRKSSPMSCTKRTPVRENCCHNTSTFDDQCSELQTQSEMRSSSVLLRKQELTKIKEQETKLKWENKTKKIERI